MRSNLLKLLPVPALLYYSFRMPSNTHEDFYRKEKADFTRHLRKNMTIPEKVLWEVLRDRRSRGVKFRRQVNIGPYIVDFLCKEHRLIVEVDGGIHRAADRHEHDEARSAYFAELGLKVVRILNETVMKDLAGALEQIHRAI